MESQLAGPQWLNSAELAKALCESGELDSRENEFKCFRDKGLPQYRMTRKMLDKWSSKSSHAEISMSSSLTKEEYAEVAEAMQSADKEPPRKKVKVEKTPKLETPEKKEMKELQAAVRWGLRKLKASFDRLGKAQDDSKKMIPQVKGKGFPQELCDHFASKLEGYDGVLGEAQKLYADLIIKRNSEDNEQLKTWKDDVETKTKQIDEAALAQKKGEKKK